MFWKAINWLSLTSGGGGARISAFPCPVPLFNPRLHHEGLAAPVPLYRTAADALQRSFEMGSTLHRTGNCHTGYVLQILCFGETLLIPQIVLQPLLMAAFFSTHSDSTTSSPMSPFPKSSNVGLVSRERVYHAGQHPAVSIKVKLNISGLLLINAASMLSGSN